MVFAYGPVPILHQGIYNNHADAYQKVEIRAPLLTWINFNPSMDK